MDHTSERAGALPVRSVVVDFDGTIVPQDVSEELLKAFGAPEWWDIDLAFQRGEIGSRECLVRQAALLRGSVDEMLAYCLERFAVDPTFPPFVEWAFRSGLDMTVASDGLGFYVEPMLEAAGVHGATVMTNRYVARPEGPVVEFPAAHSECIGCGTCKMRVALARRRTGAVAFVGEGHSDRYGALYSDLVFATKHLADLARADGIPFLPWESFDDVRAGIERLRGADPPGPVAPDPCPGWTVP